MDLLILGATGNIGHECVDLLLKKGFRPTVGVRALQRARKTWGNRVVYRHFDFKSFDTYPAALDQIERLFFIAPFANPVPHIARFLELAAKEGIQHINPNLSRRCCNASQDRTARIPIGLY